MRLRILISFTLVCSFILSCSCNEEETSDELINTNNELSDNSESSISSNEKNSKQNQNFELINGMILIPPADYMMGANDELKRPDELPRHKVMLDKFLMDETEVTNAQFRKFVEGTGYVTTAEKKPDW